ncbi:MAG: hypothetical protein ACRDD1_05590, partial [Planctomycetia bacterium]
DEWSRSARRAHQQRQRSTELQSRLTGTEEIWRRDFSDDGRGRVDADAVAAERKELDDQVADGRRRLAAARDAAAKTAENLTRRESQATGLESQRSILLQQRERLAERGRRLILQKAALQRERAAMEGQRQGAARHRRTVAAAATGLVEEHRRRLAARADVLQRAARAREQRSAVAGRLDALDALQRRHEGMEGGVRAALHRRASGDPLWKPIIGLLVEMLDVDAEYADVVELALGPLAQAVLVRRRSDLDETLVAAAHQLPGRIHLLPIDETPVERLVVYPDEITGPSLASLVRCEPILRPMVDRLLGSTFLADDVPSALAAAEAAVDARLVTLAGDLVAADGSVSAGPKASAAGFLARA